MKNHNPYIDVKSRMKGECDLIREDIFSQQKTGIWDDEVISGICIVPEE